MLCKLMISLSFGLSMSGPGIAPENQAAVFEKFKQLDQPPQMKISGTRTWTCLAIRLLIHIMVQSVSAVMEKAAAHFGFDCRSCNCKVTVVPINETTL